MPEATNAIINIVIIDKIEIMKQLLHILFLFVSTSITAQSTLPYFTSFDNAQDTAGWQEFRKGDLSLYHWNFASFGAFSAPYSLMHNYPVGGSQPTRDWYVSPAFDFSNGGKIDSIYYAFSGFGVPNSDDTIAIYLLSGSPDPAIATTHTLIKEYRGADYINDNTWRLDTGLVIPPSAGLGYIAFKYVTTNNWLDVKFDNLRLSGNFGAGIIGERNQDFKIYPNPASEFLTVENQGNRVVNIELFDITGRLIKKYKIAERGEVDLGHIKKGMALLRISVDEEVYFRKIMVQ